MALRRARHARVSSAGLSVRTGACVRFKRRRSLSASRLIPGIVRRGEYLAFAPGALIATSLRVSLSVSARRNHRWSRRAINSSGLDAEQCARAH